MPTTKIFFWNIRIYFAVALGLLIACQGQTTRPDDQVAARSSQHLLSSGAEETPISSHTELTLGSSSSLFTLSSSSFTSSGFSSSSHAPVQADPFTIPVLHIYTQNGDSVLSNTTTVLCSIFLDGKNHFANYFVAGVQIRQRGNSSRIFYPKKPYRIKLPVRAALLGLAEERDWVLLANYRDPTNFMNAVAFSMAQFLQMPYTNNNRFVELFINGEYLGMYQLTEQVEQGRNRVAVDSLNGLLLNLDLDDGPDLAPTAIDNFYSRVFQLPVAVKHPKDPTAAMLQVIAEDFSLLENLILNQDWINLSSKLQVNSLIDFLIISELTRNVELVSPRSVYLHRQSNGIYQFGPVWDFDGGYAFNWSSMTTGHEYFTSQSWLMGDTNPSTHPRTAYNRISPFFVGLFGVPQFVQAYQARWDAVKSGLLEFVFNRLDSYSLQTRNARAANSARWPIGKNSDEEILRLKEWLRVRVLAYDAVVKAY